MKIHKINSLRGHLRNYYRHAKFEDPEEEAKINLHMQAAIASAHGTEFGSLIGTAFANSGHLRTLARAARTYAVCPFVNHYLLGLKALLLDDKCAVTAQMATRVPAVACNCFKNPKT